ncbi:MAG: hypothetical protein JO028_19855 [Acidobacteriaceae bacterium]|nr:hypothetical protein [Acidobacteriaceae bacterium]
MGSIYLVAPVGDPEPLATMKPFLYRALDAGIRRFVFLSSSAIAERGPALGQVHHFLKGSVPALTVLRPTWFMQSFSEGQHISSIRSQGIIYSATDNGRVPFIDAGDIAAVAAEVLLRPSNSCEDLVLTGPDLLSCDDVATIISRVAGYPVKHHGITSCELSQRYHQAGMPSQYAQVLAELDARIAAGSENRLTDEVLRITGRPPTSFQQFAEEAGSAWKRAA